MPIFPDAHGFVIKGGNYYDIQNGGKQTGFEILQQSISPGAFHDSGERFDPPKCHPDTRHAVLGNIMSWVDVRERSPRIMWLHGPAGAGKSAIAQTTAERCSAKGKLIASFFFSRTTAGRNTESRLFSTLSYQFALSVPDSRARIEDAIINDPTLLTRSLKTQVQRLIIDPLSSCHYRSTSAPHLIIIDGLDECENSNSAHARILQSIANALQQSDVSLCVLITSRPEEDIRNTFNADELCAISTRLALDDSFSPQKDIEVFLQSKFAELKRKHPVRSLSESWPPQESINTLVDRSSGQFIYASTVMHYISDVRHHPTKRLDIVLGIAPRGDDRPFAQLNALYLHIFSCIPDLLGTSRVIGVLLLKYSLETKSPAMIDKFLHLAPGDTYLLLSDLHSVLSIPDGSSSKSPIRLLHASLGDFLLDQSRSGEYFINVADVHADFAECCFRHCVRGPASRYLPQVYTYSVQYLFHHLRQASFTASLRQQLGHTDFSRVLVLCNVETIASDLVLSLSRLQEEGRGDPELFDIYQHLLASFDRYHLALLERYPQDDDCDLDRNTIGLIRRSAALPHEYYTWICAFLQDPCRAKDYYLDGEIYARAALLCFDFVSGKHRSPTLNLHISKFCEALDRARFAIQNASVVADLEEHLSKLPVGQLWMEYPWLSDEKLRQLWKAITQYLKKCDSQYGHIVVHMTNSVHLAIPGVEDEAHTVNDVHLAIPGVEDEVPSCFSCRWLRK